MNILLPTSIIQLSIKAKTNTPVGITADSRFNPCYLALPVEIASTVYFNIWRSWGESLFFTKDLGIGWHV